MGETMRRRARRSAVVVVALALASSASGSPPAAGSANHAVAPAPGQSAYAENAGAVSFHVVVTPPPEAATHGMTVPFSVTGVTATCGTDYTVAGVMGACPNAQHGTLTYTAGDGDESIAITITNDVQNEGDETFVIGLGSSTCTVVAPNSCNGFVPSQPQQATVTITDDDAATFTVSDASASEGDPVAFTVTLSRAPGAGQSATVTCDTSPPSGTATSGVDYPPTTQTLNFGTGVTSLPCAVPTIEDAAPEADETFRVSLTNASGANGFPSNPTATDTGIGTITNDDGTGPNVTVDDASANEGDAVGFTVTLSAACPAGTTLNLPVDTRRFTNGLPSGTASETTDYVRTQQTLSFTGAEKTKPFVVSTVEDTVDEGDETFSVFLGDPSGTCGAKVTDGEGVGTIKNDDAPPVGAIQITAGKVQVKEGDSLTRPCFVPVTLNTASTSPVTVKYATADGTATEDEDYAKNSGTLTFAPGTTTQRVEVTVFGDKVNDKGRRETVLVNLSSPTGATIAAAQGKCKIFEGRRP